ncbi:MAG: UDP-glucose 4-epimerase GalE [bacterium]
MAILVTGGAGYIGSHTLVELSEAGLEFIVYDNLSNSSKEALRRVEQITGKPINFIEGDIRDSAKLDSLFKEFSIDSVIHFAGLKAVGESVEKPLEYYDNNVVGTLRLLEAMQKHNCKKIVFSSSATVYGDPATMPIKENLPVGGTTNPYGTSKYMIERILQDLHSSDARFQIAILRYFNPVGAHKSGLIGEDPNGIPNNLMPFISQVAVGKREFLNVFGDDYPTVDGTGVRDYIHVVDLAKAHVKAIEYLQNPKVNPLIANLGCGKGYSVLEMVQAFSKACGKEIPYQITPRRPGDIAECYADPGYAKEQLKWQAELTIKEMCQDSWHWQSTNPQGYDS